METGTIALRERTRRAVQAELTAAAMDLFAAQGFESTTIDQIASAAGLSRRSFFRYFSTKDEVLLHRFDATGDLLAAALAARPAGEEPWQALRRCFDGLVDQISADPERSVVLLSMLLASPALTGAHRAKRASWSQALMPPLRVRLARDTASPGAATTGAHLTAAALAGSALACLEAAQAAWVATSGADFLSDLLDFAMGAVQPL